MYKIFLLLFVYGLAGCVDKQISSESEVGKSVDIPLEQKIVDKAIEVSGGDKYLNSSISFKFRDYDYIGTRKDGLFTYERIFSDNTGKIRDIYDNNGFIRELNGKKIAVPDSMAIKYLNSINSVFYFALLPYGLNDPAVYKAYKGLDSIDGGIYHKVEISFDEQGGGKDFDDVFLYWIDTSSFNIDYFGYTYKTDGGGARFRKAYNSRDINGLRFQDYINYKPVDEKVTPLLKFDSLFQKQGMTELSRIELEEIKVEIF
ncbi:MAG: hypothetical protein OEW75_12780 [Cyclobacteriaceae bacterium]|nr:hypothetical protein [Cyclobacteriaceae bacterium]